MNSKIFERELTYIEDDAVRKFTETALDNLPQYFFEVAASSTGKYHPTYALGDGGLVRHTKAAVRFANHLFTIEQNKNAVSSTERSCVISAIILHDGWKHGDKGSAFTTHEHPVVCADWIKNAECLNDIINDGIRNAIASAVASHMGEWNESKRSTITLPKPETDIQKFVHMCDYLASRKDIEVHFDEIKSYEKPTIDTYVFNFGKHNGKSFKTVMEEDPSYLTYLKSANYSKEPLRTFLSQIDV